MFHKHNWRMIDKTVLPGKNLTDVKAHGAGMEMLADIVLDKVVHVFKCNCGKVKVVRNR